MSTSEQLVAPGAGAPGWVDDGPDDQVRTSGVRWQWVGWASWKLTPPIVLLAAVTLVLDAASAWLARPLGYLGPASISPALAFACVLVLLVGPRAMGLSRASILESREFLATTAVALVLGAQYYTTFIGPWSHVGGLVVAGVGEELVYRAGSVIVFGAAFARLRGRDWHDTAAWGNGPVLGAIAMSAIVFSVLPGHVDQMVGPMEVVPFASLAIVLGYVMMRTGSVLAISIVHVLVDLAAMAYLRGGVGNGGRMIFAGALLVSLIPATVIAGQRRGLLRRVPSVIDLRVVDHDVLAGEMAGTAPRP